MDELRVVGCYPLPPLVVAEEQGFFAREGLQVGFEIARSAREHNRGMLTGRWDISLTSPHAMVARAVSSGQDFVSYLMVEGGLAFNPIGARDVQPPEANREGGPALAADNSKYNLLRRMIARAHGAHGTERDIEILRAAPARSAGRNTRRVSAGWTAPAFDVRSLINRYDLLARTADHDSIYATTACWARRAWVAENRDKMLRFVRAFVVAADWALAPENREEALSLLQSHQKLSRAQAEARLARVTPKAAIVPQDLNRVVELRSAMGCYGPPHEPIERFYDASLWSEATGLPRPPPFGMPRSI